MSFDANRVIRATPHCAGTRGRKGGFGNGSGVYVDDGTALIVNTDATLDIDGVCEGTSNSLMVCGKDGTDGSDLNLGDGATVTASGYVEVRSTGTAGDSGLLVKGNATLDSAGSYFYDDTKVEFQGGSKWTLTVVGGFYVLGDFGINFRAAYGGTADKIVADDVGFSGSNNTVTTYCTGTPQVQDFKLIDTPSSYSGQFNTTQSSGAAIDYNSASQGQLCSKYDPSGGDLTFQTLLHP